MPLDSTRRCFNELSWPQVERAVAIDRATLVWPFGACEQHGPQLPLATDALFAERLLAAGHFGLRKVFVVGRDHGLHVFAALCAG